MRLTVQSMFHIAPLATLLMTGSGLVHANMPTTFLEVDAVPGVYYGWGYDIHTMQFTSPCVKVNTAATYPSGSPSEGTAFEFAETTATIAAKSNLSASASLKILAGMETYQANTKLDVAGGTESSTYSQSLFANVYRYDAPEFLDINHVSFKEGPRSLLTTPGGSGQFKQQCGDGFVLGVQKGREFVGTATVTRQDLKSWTKFASETEATASGTWGTAKAGLNLGEQMERSFGSQNISVKTYSTGSTLPKPSQAKDLQDYYQKFLNSHGDKAMIKLIVAPYKLIEGYPWENPLREMGKDDYVGMMVVALWGLRAAIADANYILDPATAKMFALGSRDDIKKSRVSYVQQQRDAWQREYDMLLAAAQKCDANFDASCRELAEYYDRHRHLRAQWHAIMPERYLSDCYQPLVINPTDSLKTALTTANFRTPVEGDSETAGNRSRVVAKLRLNTDHRQLKADLAVAKIEWKRDEWRNQPLDAQGESAWGLSAQAVLVDLDRPQQYGLGQVNLKSCTWQGVGYQPMKIQSPQATQYFHRYGLQHIEVQGYIDGISGKNPRGQQHFGEGKGYLNFITCEVDRPGKDNDMQCLDLGMRNIPLTLVSSQDLDADNWTRPPAPQLPTVLVNFSGNRPLAVQQNLAQFKVFADRLSEARKEAVTMSERQKATITNKFKTMRVSLPEAQMQLIQKRLQEVPGLKVQPLRTPEK